MYVVFFSALVVNQEKFEDGSWREAAQFFPPSQSRVSSQSHPSVIAPFPKMGQFPSKFEDVPVFESPPLHTVRPSAPPDSGIEPTTGRRHSPRPAVILLDRVNKFIDISIISYRRQIAVAAKMHG
jgi:hypothetical protein